MVVNHLRLNRPRRRETVSSDLSVVGLLRELIARLSSDAGRVRALLYDCRNRDLSSVRQDWRRRVKWEETDLRRLNYLQNCRPRRRPLPEILVSRPPHPHSVRQDSTTKN